MKTHAFSLEDMEVLRGIRNGRFISSLVPSDLKTVSDFQHESWVRDNLHAHNEREILICLRGDGYQTFAGRTYPVSPGTVMLFDKKEPHQNGYPKDRRAYRHLVCSFLNHGCVFTLVDVDGNDGVRPYRTSWIDVIRYDRFGGEFEKTLFPKLSSGTPVELLKQLISTSVELLVTSLLVEMHQPEVDDRHNVFQVRVVLGMVRYIEDHHGRNCSVETLSQIAGYSRAYFSQLFKKHTGMSITDCVNASRKRAIKYMLARQLPVKVIAKELGFAHESTLCRWRRENEV